MNEITPGTYKGTIADYGINESKKGNPQVFIKFDIKEINKTLTWYGSLINEKAAEITCKVLINCGFSKSDMAIISEGKESNALDLNKELELEIIQEEFNGKTHTKIQWVNLPYSGIQNKLDKSGAVQKLAGLNVNGTLMKLQQEMGTQPHVTNGTNNSGQQGQQGQQFASEDTPF